MSRDYASNHRRKPKGKNTRVKPSHKPLPGWVWMVGGIFVGVLGSGLYHSIRTPEADQHQAESPSQPVEAPKEAHKPRFDFYTLLQESEIVIPDEDTAKPAPQPVVIPEPDEPREQEKVATTAAPETMAAKTATTSPAAEQASTTSPTQPTTQKLSAPERTVYVLQAGSFKNGDDADSVRASLLLLNMQANIETVPAGNNQTWHRVLVGPFSNTTELSQAKAILTRNGIDSIQLKRRM